MQVICEECVDHEMRNNKLFCKDTMQYCSRLKYCPQYPKQKKQGAP